MSAGNSRTALRMVAISAALLLALLLASHLTACAGPGYYWQAAAGHLSLMHARQPVDEAIERGVAGDRVIEKLKLSKEIRAFAVDELGLPANDSYTEFVHTGQEAVVWNVIAAPEFSLDAKEWCFPVSGCVPYRGYFDRSKAERFAAKLNERQFDVVVSPAIAYSTLGWFEDPLLDTMWRQSDAQFAAYLFHELAHQALYVKGDATFNESYASFVEEAGVGRWLTRRGERDALARWQSQSEAAADFNALLERTRENLRAVYASGATPETKRIRKQDEFERMASAYETLKRTKWQGRDYFGRWFEQPSNNARFALLDTYEGGRCAFAALFDQAGGDFDRFHELARARSRLPPEQRSEWLEQPCPDEASAADIAPAGEL